MPLDPTTATRKKDAVKSINWTRRLVIAALTTSLSGVGVASAQSLGDRAGMDNNPDRYGQQEDQNRGDRRDGEKIEQVSYGRDYKRDNHRWGRGHRRDHGRHRGWYKRKHNKHGHDHDYGRRYGRR